MISEPDVIARAVEAALEEHLVQFEREQDKLIGEARRLKKYNEKLETQLAQLVAEMPFQKGTNDALDFPTTKGNAPVVVFDLHRTLTPAYGFPIREEEGIFPYIREKMDEWTAKNVICVISSASLAGDHYPLVLAARRRLAQAFVQHNALPVKPEHITGKINAHIFLDDRMVPVDSKSNEKDPWTKAIPLLEQEILKRTEYKNGRYTMIELPDVGKQIVDWPDEEDWWGDQPRGFSTPILNVDAHRCLFYSNSSEIEGPGIMPGAKEIINDLYDQNFLIFPSCAGWDPVTHPTKESQKRLRGLQRTIRKGGVKYDEFVSKVHGTAFADDKGMNFPGGWAAIRLELIKRMNDSLPDDELTLLYKGAKH